MFFDQSEFTLNSGINFQKDVILRRLVASFVLLFLASLSLESPAATIFQEDWNSYTGFPGSSNDLGGHRTNFGVPTIAEGADNDWLAGRFEFADSDPISGDVGVLAVASGSPFNTPAGRVDDDAGLVAKIDLTGYVDAELSFDWRTFATESSDRLVVAYYVGEDLGDPGSAYDWFGDPNLGNSDMSGTDPQGQANPWYQNNWTEVFRDTSPNSFQSESGIDISGGAGSVIYLAFWLDNGDHDLAKLDNIVVSGTPVPEASSLIIMLSAGTLFSVRWNRTRT